MEEEGDNPILEEVEALRAIYGDDKISFHPGCAQSPKTITVSLDGLTTRAPSSMKLTTRLPESYPSAQPPKPVLRSDDFTAAQCERLVDDMMRLQHGCVGVVCMYDWVQAMITTLNEHEAADARHTAEACPAGPAEPHAREFKLFHGEPLTDRKSVFQAHLAVISEAGDVDAVLAMLGERNKKVVTATHNMLAYRVRGRNGVLQDADDDGEKGAGKVVLQVLRGLKVVNVVVVVSRWFGGIKLGPVRFRHIARVVGDVVEGCKGEVEVEIVS